MNQESSSPIPQKPEKRGNLVDENLTLIKEINLIIGQKKPKIIDIQKFETTDSKCITDAIQKKILKEHKDGFWRLPNIIEPLYGVHPPELPHITRGQSGHNVFFVDARIGNKTKEIAVKLITFNPEKGDKEPSPEKALIEFINTDLIREKGIQTLTPLACIINGKKGFYLSLVEQGIEGLDQQVWPNYFTEESSRDNTTDKLNKIAINFSELHGKKIFHGDAQIKNFVTTPEGNVIPIDWESSKVYTTVTQDQFVNESRKDILSLLKSLYRIPEDFGIGIFNIASPEDNIWPPFNELVIKPYLDNLISNKDNIFPFDIVEAGGELEMKIKESATESSTYKKSRAVEKIWKRRQGYIKHA